MSKSRVTAAIYVLSAAGLLTTWAYSQSPIRPGNAETGSSPNRFSAPDDNGGPPAAASDDLNRLNPAAVKASKPSRIMFEANWKNVQVGSKAMHFRQGERPFVWTVKNVGQNPVEIGNDYGFSIAPGEEDFIVDTRLSLSVADDKTTTVEVNASRVMTKSELSQEPHGMPFQGPVYAPSASVQGFGGVPTYSPPTPNDQFAPANPKGSRKPEDKGNKSPEANAFPTL